jgi:hypothetical protein
MGLDGARSATRRQLVCGTCATRVTRGTIDFQEGGGFGLRDKEFARKFSSAERSRLLSKQKLVTHAAAPLVSGEFGNI